MRFAIGRRPHDERFTPPDGAPEKSGPLPLVLYCFRVDLQLVAAAFDDVGTIVAPVPA